MSIDVDFLKRAGYLQPRQLPDGSWAGLIPLLYTTGLCLGIGEMGYRYRFCFERREDAMVALENLTSMDDEPTGWIARRP